MDSGLTLSIYIISRHTQSYYARELKKIGVSMGQFPFIMHIADHPGISQEELASGLLIGKSTTASIIHQLMEAKLVRREDDPVDHRKTHLYLLPEAETLVPQIRGVIDSCHRKITGGFTEIERDVLLNLLNRMREKSVAQLKGK